MIQVSVNVVPAQAGIITNTADIARERGLTIDEPGYEAAMEEQRNRARAASKFSVDLRASVTIDGKTTFTGYDSQEGAATVVALIRGKEQVKSLHAGDEGQRLCRSLG